MTPTLWAHQTELSKPNSRSLLCMEFVIISTKCCSELKFNTPLPIFEFPFFSAQFLYAAEREQYDEASKTPDFTPSGYYGVVHLLRAFTTLANTIKEAGVKQQSAEVTVTPSF